MLTEGTGAETLLPLVKLVKDGRADQVPAVWKRAIKLAEAEGQDLPGQALVKRARTSGEPSPKVDYPRLLLGSEGP
jgi:hypothetical protein